MGIRKNNSSTLFSDLVMDKNVAQIKSQMQMCKKITSTFCQTTMNFYIKPLLMAENRIQINSINLERFFFFLPGLAST